MAEVEHHQDEVSLEDELEQKFEELKGDFSDDEDTNTNNTNEDSGDLDSSHRSRYSKSSSHKSSSRRRSLSGSRKHQSSRSLSSTRRKSKSSSRNLASSSGHVPRRSQRRSVSPKRSSSTRSVGSYKGSKRSFSRDTGSSSRDLVKDNRRRQSRQSSSRRKTSTSSSSQRSMADDSFLSPVSITNTVATAPVSTVDLSDTSYSNSSQLDADVAYVQGGPGSSAKHHHSPRTPSSHRKRLSSRDLLKSPSSKDMKSPRRSPRNKSSSSSGSRRKLTSSGGSRRHVLDGMSEQDEYTYTTRESTTVDLLYDDDYSKSKSSKSHASRASKPGVVMESGSPKRGKDKGHYYHHHERGSKADSLTSSGHSESLRMSSHSRKTNGTRSSRDILYGNDHDYEDEDLKAKSKSKRKSKSSRPGVEYYTEDSYEHQQSVRKDQFNNDLLYGEERWDEDELVIKKKSSKKRAHRPGIERVHGTRDLLYGDEEAKKLAMASARSGGGSGRSSSRRRNNNDYYDDGGYEYDFPIAANQPREAYASNNNNNHNATSTTNSSVMVDSELPPDEPSSVTASVADSSNNNNRAVKAGSVKLVPENKPRKKRSTFCIISGIMFALLVLVLGVVGGFVLLGNNDDKVVPLDASTPNQTLAPDTNVTLAPIAPPTITPSSLPTGAPTITLSFDPPTEEECEIIRNNQALPGQSNLERKDFSIKFDVTIKVVGDISDEAIDELIDALERLFVPRMVGCDEFQTNRNRRQLFQAKRKRRRKLNSRYVIGNADVTKIENTDFKGDEDEDAICSDTKTQTPDQCHVVEVEMAVYLKGEAKDFEIIAVISNVGNGNLVEPLELSNNTFSEVYLASAEGLDPTPSPTLAPSLQPSDIPSQVPSESPSKGPTTAPSIPPTLQPVAGPTPPPTASPTKVPTLPPTPPPTIAPTTAPSVAPSKSPTTSPSRAPSKAPVVGPSPPPTINPTSGPTLDPTSPPTDGPTFAPTTPNPTSGPTSTPTSTPTTPNPTSGPTLEPTSGPTSEPTQCDYCFTGACDAASETLFDIGCESCDGANACTSLTQSSISFIGSYAVGEASCVGENSCESSVIQTIGDDSCDGPSACKGRQINIGDRSCTDQQACEIFTDYPGGGFTPEPYWNPSRLLLLTVGNDSCIGNQACVSQYGTIGSNSCVGDNACAGRGSVDIANNACVGEFSCGRIFSCGSFCFSTPAIMVVAEGSCLENFSCQCMQTVNEPGKCQRLGDCCQVANPMAKIAGQTWNATMN